VNQYNSDVPFAPLEGGGGVSRNVKAGRRGVLNEE
jgi:hypothetical protein